MADWPKTETTIERVEMLREHLQILENLRAAPEIVEIVRRVIKIAEQRLAGRKCLSQSSI